MSNYLEAPTEAARPRPSTVSTLASFALIGIALAVFLGRARGPQWAIALGVIGSLLITPFYHPDDMAILVPAAWLWMHSAPAALERTLVAAGLGGALLLGTPLPLVLCLAAALIPAGDLLSAIRAPMTAWKYAPRPPLI